MVEIRKLTDAAVRAANAPGKYFDGAGLLLAVTPKRSGGVTKSWLVRFTAPDGRAREMGLGAYPEITLAAAREAAAERRDEARKGHDPLEAKDVARKARKRNHAKTVTFAWCGERYVGLHETSWKNAKHRYQWRATLSDYVYPLIGHIAVSDIDTELVMRVLEPIWTDKRETAARVRSRMEIILNWAATSGYRDRNVQNPAVWRGHLQFLLPKRRSRRLVKHLPALPYREAPAFVASLQHRDGIGVRALEFTILCATRSAETRLATWKEIDLEKGVWTIPAERMKAGLEHRVPLAKEALHVLTDIRAVTEAHGPDSFVFPGPGKRPLSDAGMRAVLQRMDRAAITVHGFRSTFRDWAAEQTTHSPEVIKMALAHAIEDQVDAAYRRGELFEKRAALMADWASYCVRSGARAGLARAAS